MKRLFESMSGDEMSEIDFLGLFLFCILLASGI